MNKNAKFHLKYLLTTSSNAKIVDDWNCFMIECKNLMRLSNWSQQNYVLNRIEYFLMSDDNIVDQDEDKLKMMIDEFESEL